MRFPSHYPGFNLVELIVTMGMITLLAGIVIVAINPAYLFAKSRNTRRATHLATIHKAINQYASDTGNYPVGITTVPKRIGTQSGTYMVDLTSVLSPYLTDIPYDPQLGSTADTRYTVFLNEGGNLVVAAPAAENKERIAIGTTNKVLSLNGGYVNFGNDTGTSLDVGGWNATTNPYKEISIEAWINLNIPGACEQYKQYPIISNEYYGGNLQYFFEILGGCHLRYRTSNSVTTLAGNVFAKTVNGVMYPNNGKWYHVAMTYKNYNPVFASNGLMILYVNGVEVARSTNSGGASNSGSEVPVIGGNITQVGQYSPPGPEFLGKIDELRVYNRALSASFIAERAKGTGFLDAPPADGSLAAYFAFDESDGKGKVYDMSGAVVASTGQPLSGQFYSNSNPVSPPTTNGDSTINWSVEKIIPQ